jgi:DnaD/phage-associated family protein
MKNIFQGFQENKKRFSSLPDQFFSELLPEIDDINELKLTIYMLWSAYTQGDYGTAFKVKDFLLDKVFTDGLQAEGREKEEIVNDSLQKALQRGSIIRVENEKNDDAVYFINSPRGRKAAELLQQESPQQFKSEVKATLDIIQPNIFQLYADNIGPLTPIIADELRDAQSSYPAEWIEEAMRLAIKNNVRRWKYIESILNRWQEEGKDGADRRNDQKDHRRYIEGEYGEIGQH